MIASNIIKIPPEPPEKYIPRGWSGATESTVHLLTEELAKRGHNVTLFASGNSKTKAKLFSVTKSATSQTEQFKNRKDYEHALISKAYQMASLNHFDILHSHFDVRTTGYAALCKTPTVSTLHSPLEWYKKEILSLFKKTQYYVSISDSQRRSLPDLNYAGTVYNGIDIKKIPFSEKKEDYLIFFGRIAEEKGVAEAISTAKKTKNKLLIFGSPVPDGRYWKKIKPLIDQKQIIYKGFTSKKELYKHCAKAKAFLFPLQWEEPFGLSVIESLAAGTPVVAFKKGSLPEIIYDGKTGFLCKNSDEMARSLNKINLIRPSDCRKRAEELFTAEKMADGYEQIYYKIINRRKYPSPKANF